MLEAIKFWSVLVGTLVITMCVGIAIGRIGADRAFTSQQCNVVPTGRTHKTVAAITADGGKPVGVVERTTAIEYATICERAEWVEQ
jgi:hypothetical protein